MNSSCSKRFHLFKCGAPVLIAKVDIESFCTNKVAFDIFTLDGLFHHIEIPVLEASELVGLISSVCVEDLECPIVWIWLEMTTWDDLGNRRMNWK